VIERLTAADGHELAAYRADPAGTPRGALVILSEFFGVNRHIRRVADDYAARGYVTLAPALFDRIQRDVELEYDDAGMRTGRTLRSHLNLENTLLDVQAGIDAGRLLGGAVAPVGYCWGGVLAYLAALRLTGLDCAVGYYGANIPEYIAEAPRVPVLLHFAETDEYMQPGDVERVAAAHPEISIFTYPGTEHGFNCDERRFYDAAAAELALGRTLAFLAQHLPLDDQLEMEHERG
jgi:carboxymethylenebutenolidase